LRYARPCDTGPLYDVFYQSVHIGAAPAYCVQQRHAWAPKPSAPKEWDARLLDQLTVLAEKDGAYLGFATLGRDGFLDFLYVAPDARRGHTAPALLHQVEHIARALGLGQIETHASLLARSFLLKHGWVLGAEQSVERGGVMLTNFKMRKCL
jgi:putative acetyltransferase